MITVSLYWNGNNATSRRRGYEDEAIRRAIRDQFGRRARWEEDYCEYSPDGSSLYFGTVGNTRVKVRTRP